MAERMGEQVLVFIEFSIDSGALQKYFHIFILRVFGGYI